MSQQIDFTVELYHSPNFDVACERAMEVAIDIVNSQEADDKCFTLERIEFTSLNFDVGARNRDYGEFIYHFTVHYS